MIYTEKSSLIVASPRAGLLRLSEILAPVGPIPVSPSTWWQGVRDGRYPQPVKLGPRITAWRTDDIQVLVERGVAKPMSRNRGRAVAAEHPDKQG